MTTSFKPSRLSALRAGLLLAAIPAAAYAQPAIYSNGGASPSSLPLATGATTLSGAAAPVGGLWSEVQSDATGCNAVGGFSAHITGAGGAFRFADDFTVTSTPGWRIDTISLYAYRTGVPAGVSPFSGVNLRIWSGRPGDAGSTVVFGDTTTNRMASSTSTNIYRAFNTTALPAPATPDSTRLIWRTDITLPHVFLTPGTYWLDWQYTSVIAGGEAFCPPVTLAGVRSQAAWNARQFNTTLGWVDVMDLGKPASSSDVHEDLPFVIVGFAGTQPCNADFNGDGDVGTDADIEAFFACLAGNCCATCGTADFNADGDVGTDADIESFFRVLAGGPC